MWPIGIRVAVDCRPATLGNQQRKESTKSLRKPSSVGASGEELDAPALPISTSPFTDHTSGPLSPDRSPLPTAVSGQSSAYGSTNHPPAMTTSAHTQLHDDEEEQMFKFMPWLKVSLACRRSVSWTIELI